MKKKVLSLLFVLSILCLFTPLIANAEIIKSGVCGADGDNLIWTLDDNGTLTISGTGDMKDYSPSLPASSTIAPWGSNISNVVIENGVTSISGSAFYNCTGLTSVTIPDSVTSIGTCAFEDCTGLTNVTIPDSVTSIVYGVFSGCSGLKSVTIGNGVTSIGNSAFYDCTGLTSITVPDSVTNIRDGAFCGCENLQEITLPFVGCSRTENNSYAAVFGYIFGFQTGPNSWAGTISQYYRYYYYIPDSLRKVTITDAMHIPYQAFYDCAGLTSINIPDSVTSIGENAFYDCTGLTSINIPNSVTSIGNSAFYNTGYAKDDTNWENGILYIDNCLVAAKSNITDVNIKNECRLIANSVFGNCSNLDSVYISDLAAYLNINFGNDKSSPMYYANKLYLNDKRVTALEIPEGVTKIPFYAFEGCDSLKKITLPNSVTDIQNNAFKDCINLSDITIPNKVTTIGDFAFSDCSGLTRLDIPNGVKTIGKSAFSGCSGLTSLKIPNSVTSIAQETFANCSNLETITIPDSVTNIDWGTRYNGPFYNCHSLKSIVIPNGVTNIASYAFSGCSGLTSVTIGSGVMRIGEDAFYDCRKLTDVYISSLEWWIDNYSNFNSNPMSYANNIYINGELVRNVVIPDDHTEIKSGTFSGWGCLESITIPEIVTSIGSSAFSNCNSLTSVTIPNSVTNIDDKAFSGCNNLVQMTYNAPKLFSNVFASNSYYDKNNLLFLVLGMNVSSIDENALAQCNNLKRILIPKSVTEIESSAFKDCSCLTTVEYGGSQSDWEEMYIGTNNENLTNAKIIYNSSLTNTTLTDLDYLTYTKNDDNTITITNCNTAATNINIPEKIDGLNVSAIGSQAFYNCNKLTTVTIPNSITSIGSSAFYNCDSLKDVYFTGTEKQWKAINISWSNDTLTNATIHYNGVAPTPKPTPTPTPKPTPKPTPIPTTTATVTKSETDTTYNFDVSPEAAYANCYVYAAVYDERGVLLAVNRVPLALTGNTSISVNKSTNDALAKVFIWADSLQPITEKAEEFTLTD